MSAAPSVLIIGAGGFGRSVADAIVMDSRYTVAGFVDDRGPALGLVLGHAVLGRLADLPSLRRHGALVLVAIGDNAKRREAWQLARDSGFELATLVHPRAFVSAHASVGAGAMVMAGAIIGTEARIGQGVIVNAAAVVDHHAQVGDFAHLGVGACMGGAAVLGPGAWLTEGAVLRAGRVMAAAPMPPHPTPKI